MSNSGKKITSAQIVDGTIVDADIAAAGVADIAPGKLAAGGVANRVLATNNGVAGSPSFQQILSAMIANGQLAAQHFIDGQITAPRLWRPTATPGVFKGTGAGNNGSFGQATSEELTIGAAVGYATVVANGSTSQAYPNWGAYVTFGSQPFLGRPVLLIVSLIASMAAAADLYIGFSLDGGGVTQMLLTRVGTTFTQVTAVAPLGIGAGSHTVALHWMVSSSTVTTWSGSNAFLLELRR